MKNYDQLYKEELLNNIIPFWMNNSVDKDYGGFFTCLDRTGKVYDTDKFLWLQGRQTWLFSMLYNEVENKDEWLAMAEHGADFLKKNGRDKDGNWYFSLTREGKPLVQPYNIFSDCFAALGFGALYKATGNEEYAEITINTFNNILDRRINPKGLYNKIYPGTRELKNFALPMILCNLSVELEHLLPKNIVTELTEEVVHEVMETFYSKEMGVLLENVHQDGSFSDSFEGRLINPGHAIEAMWFIMDLGERSNDKNLIRKAADIAIDMLNYGWDKEYGGIFYFMDVKGKPTQQLEWDQKLWWVHMESLVCMAKVAQLYDDKEAVAWFEKLHNYTWNSFKDPEYPEWYGYLNREGKVLLPLKGGKWKGCFHMPRGLFQIWKTLEKVDYPHLLVK